MQNQPGAGPRKHERVDVVHDRQAARTQEDAFKGGSPKRGLRIMGWLRKPWQPAAGRLFPERVESDDDK